MPAPFPSLLPALLARTAWLIATGATILSLGRAVEAAPAADGCLVRIGEADASPLELGLPARGWQGFALKYPRPIVFIAGRSDDAQWPFIHPSTHDAWAGGKPHTFTVRFRVDESTLPEQHLVLGLLAAHEPSRMTIAVNDRVVTQRRLPALPPQGDLAGDPQPADKCVPVEFPIPAEAFHPGENTLGITLDDGSWAIYDYVRLGPSAEPPKLRVESSALLPGFLEGPMKGVEEIVVAMRPVVSEHWYANFAYYAAAPDPSNLEVTRKIYREGGKLCRVNLRTGKRTTILEDAQGNVRDPQVHFDGNKILFSYRKGGTEHYHLYEIGADGSGLRQLTDGEYDDIEPSYLPDGGIVFVSSRCKRWVNCWASQVAVLHRCDADGRNLHAISSNNEHDNTPWPLPDGRILYTRWEYVDRSQVHYHHLWVVNPDGSGQMVFYGNLRPGTVMIDAKPIPNSDKIVVAFSPGHGQTEHEGPVMIVDPKAGPDAAEAVQGLRSRRQYRDPWAFSETCLMGAAGPSVFVFNDRGRAEEIFTLDPDEVRAGFQCHEPRPLARWSPGQVIPARSQAETPAGRLVLADIHVGRNMAGVARGEVRKLLVLESLPKPINFTGGMEPLSYGGTFTLERVLGTVPVEPDGSAYFEVPALRSVFFVALDENNLAVKRMQSFVTVQPGETTSCVGCHEPRTKAPELIPYNLAALRRGPSPIEPVAGVPDVLDFPRDVQPVFDRHCLGCHDFDHRAGRIVLSGDRGPMFSHSYFALTARNEFIDGRNRPRSNYPPRTLGSSASPLMKTLQPSHYNVQVTSQEQAVVRLWIDVGAPYPGTYAALGCGMVGGYALNSLDRSDLKWPSTQAAGEVFKQRCAGCHAGPRTLPVSVSDELGRPPWDDMSPDDPRRQYARHLLYNLTRPDKSILLLAPLARESGGYGACRTLDAEGKPTETPAPVFASPSDPDYQKLLAMIVDGKGRLDEIKRFDMPGFRPRPEWVREMRRYGVLPPDTAVDSPLDVYAVERRYWESLWHRPAGQ